MKYAVDRYILGREQEVTVESFSSLSDISGRKDSLFCPECGEPVFFRKKGTGEFCHYKRIEGVTPECDKRVDGYSGLSLYERTGLSIHIVGDTSKQYYLGISFPPLGRQALDIATQQKVSIQITAGEQMCKFNVNSILFFADQSTLLPIDFLPPAGKNYAIKIQHANGIANIRQKWVNYADGLEFGGGLFRWGDEGGRKVRRGDGVSPGKHYYVVTAQPYSPPYPEIRTEQIGFIRLKNGKLTVSNLSINVSAKDANRYSLVNNHFKSRFGVWLLETAPELTTLWPPTMSQQDAQVPVTPAAKRLYCSVSSGNDTPNIYLYPETPNSPLSISESSVILPFYGSEIAASVDRKCVGRETFYRKSLRTVRTFSYEFSLEDSNGQMIDWETFTRASLSKINSVKANAKMELIIGCKGHIYQHVPIRKDNTPIPILEYPEDVHWAIQENDRYSVFFYCHEKKTTSAAQLDETCVLAALKKNRYGPLVPVPVWVAQLVRSYRKRENIKLARFICNEVRGGKIQLGFLNALFSMKNYDKG